jgi:hypothetical protein
MLDDTTGVPARQERLDALFLQNAIRSRSQALRTPGHAAPEPFRDGLEGYPFAHETSGFDMSGFRDFAIRHARHSHGQLLQDLWVAFELGSKQGGFFVEFGATNGMTFSNTILARTALSAGPGFWPSPIRCSIPSCGPPGRPGSQRRLSMRCRATPSISSVPAAR